MKRIDYTNWENEYVKYVEDVEPYIAKCGHTDRRAKFVCKNCGNEFITNIWSVKSGATKSCGCVLREQTSKRNRDKTWKRVREQPDQKFGMLKVVGEADDYIDHKSGRHQSRVKCKCDCGNESIVNAADLLSGTTTSCGCRLMSKAVERMDNFLHQMNISHSHEICFQDCFNPNTGYCLPFDFALLNSDKHIQCVIEYQGEQHYKDRGWFGKLERETTDKIKKDYCQQNNIPFYEIRYDQAEINELKNVLRKEKIT